MYDHGARNRNPVSTLWYGIDPLFEKYPDFSPYNYCAGNPVKLVDLTGKNWVKRVVDGVVEIYYDRNIKTQKDLDHYVSNGKGGGGHYVKDKYKSTILSEGFTFEGYQFYTDGTVKKNGETLDRYQKPVRGSTKTGQQYDLFIGTSDRSVDAKTLHNNWMDSYTGPNNPKDYNDYYNYDYLPRNFQEWGSYIHDLNYDKYNAQGPFDALFNTDVMEADKLLVAHNVVSALSGQQRIKSITTATCFNIIYGFKKIKKDFLNSPLYKQHPLAW